MTKYIYPVDNSKVTCHFGVKGGWACGWHIGTDYSNLHNNNIYAICDSVVIGVNNLKNTSYGNHIMLKHTDGYVSLYAHLSSIYVQKGDKINSGETIALMGASGTTAKHLHIELHENAWKYPKKNQTANWLENPHKFITERIKNMENQELNLSQSITILMQKVGLERKTIDFLLCYKHGEDLVKKLAKAI